MQEQTNLSGNTYIEFSFQKSLRKYEKGPQKKIKPNIQCSSHNHNLCRPWVAKLNRKDSVQSQDRLINLQSCRKYEHIKSRYKAREFSQTKRKKELQSSVNKERQSSLRNQNEESEKKIQYRHNYHNPLSQFKVGEQLNMGKYQGQTIQKFSKQKVGSMIQAKEITPSSQMQNGLSIERVLEQGEQMACNQQKGRQSVLSEEHKLAQFDRGSNSKIIEEHWQDESFSQIEILHSRALQQSETQFKQEQRNSPSEKQHNIPHNNRNQNNYCQQYPAIGYAYFSSCSSLESFSSSSYLNLAQKPQDKNKENTNEQDEKQFLKSFESNKEVEQQDRFQLLKLQSKQELKKQSRRQYRDRLFYKIKKINQVQQAYSQCSSITEDLKKQLQIIQQSSINEQPSRQTASKQTISPLQQGIQNDESNNAYCLEADSAQNIQQPMQQISQPNPSLKRDRNNFEAPSYEHSTRRKTMKINFEIQQNYQCLGRVRISGLGEEKQSICLSIRRFSHQSRSHGSHGWGAKSQDIKIDKSKMVDYLISHRPYLQKSREQLIKLLSQIIDSRQNSIAKRLFQ